MDRTERFYKIDNLLRQRRIVPIETFLEELGISRATFKRDLEYLRDRLHAPITYDRELGGYRFEEGQAGGPEYELPGLWFNPSEIHALLTMEHLLATMQPGLLERHIAPLRARITALLETADQSAEEIRGRIKLMTTGHRPVTAEHFEQIAHALLKRHRLRIRHHNRATGEETERTISPQRLTYLNGNWYLDAWCHMRKAIRRFGMDVIELVAVESTPAKEIKPDDLEKVLGAGYGAFTGSKTQTAELLFSPQRSKWACNEHWHADQEGQWQEDGRYLLKIPFVHEGEMVSQVLRYGAEVTVLAPGSLRKKVEEEARKVLQHYT